MAETEIDWPWQYIREIKPGPVGCGSSLTSWCAALAAALADWAGQAALTEAYPERDDSLLQDISAVASVYQQELLALAEQDVKAVQQLNEASKLPAGTAEEWEERRLHVEQAAKAATRVPLETARLCVEILHLSENAVKKGPQETVTDAVAAGLLARASLRIASYKIRACLGCIVGDRSFITAVSTDLNRYEHHAAVLESSVIRAADKVLLNN